MGEKDFPWRRPQLQGGMSTKNLLWKSRGERGTSQSTPFPPLWACVMVDLAVLD